MVDLLENSGWSARSGTSMLLLRLLTTSLRSGSR